MITTPKNYSIQQVSEMTGLTASVLRIWELRYGWPLPKRKTNGYRSYSQHQVEDLTRMAALVKDGIRIRSLIQDGMPSFSMENAPRRKERMLSFTRSLPIPSGRSEALLQCTLVDALDQHRFMEIQQILQRIFWAVRPQDEAKTALIPTLMAISELNSLNRPIPEARNLMTIVRDRCMQLLRMHCIAADALFVVPARGGDDALAALVAVMLCHRDIPARPWMQPGVPTTAFLLATDSDGVTLSRRTQLGIISLRGGPGSQSLVELLDASFPVIGVQEAVRT